MRYRLGMNALSSWGFADPFLPPTKAGWLNVPLRFARLFAAIDVPAATDSDGLQKAAGITATLNRTYWPHGAAEPAGLVSGSWGKGTRVHPSGDLDLIYILPPEVYHRYQARAGNRQSALLQEIKNLVAASYPRTEMRGDGQVVVVDFTSIRVEVVPAFRTASWTLLTCDTHYEGTYKVSDPHAEYAALDRADWRAAGRVRRLVRLMKLWCRASGADLPGFSLEMLGSQFMQTWAHADWDWWDWMVRDFLAFLVTRANTWVYFPTTHESYWLGDGWVPRALKALRAADAACAYEAANLDAPAADQWCAIFGRRMFGA